MQRYMRLKQILNAIDNMQVLSCAGRQAKHVLGVCML
jgi:hypothetical protein